MERIPLNERLRSIRVKPHDFLNLFLAVPEYFYTAMSEMCSREYFKNIYNEKIEKYAAQHYTTMCELVDKVWNLEISEESELLYRILIEPFAILYVIERN